MNTKLSGKWAKINIVIIGIFYIISGIWEHLVGLTQGENYAGGEYFLLDIYRTYTVNLGNITVLIGIGLLVSRLKFIRLLALTLAWWNLFTVPLITIWWDVYAILIKKFLITDSWSTLLFHSAILIFILTFIRSYIIYMLQPRKAGYIFLKEQKL